MLRKQTNITVSLIAPTMILLLGPAQIKGFEFIQKRGRI